MALRADNFAVTESRPDARLDFYLREKFPAASRAALKRLIEEGHVLVNGRRAKPAHSPRAGERIEVRWPEPRAAGAEPEEMALEVLFEDKWLVVVNKAAGMVIHPAAGHDEHTLVNALLHHCKGELSGIGGVARPGIVHRLDKETSGCLVAAKDDETHVGLSKQFAEREVRKVYHAIVCGAMAGEAGEVRAAIGRHPSHRKRMAVSDEERGRAAHTRWRRLERLNEATLVEARILTGRTHQIRVHFSHLGNPVAGDGTYGARENRILREATGYEAPRVMLHARQLGFVHPRTGKRMEFEAPPPRDFVEGLKRLRLPVHGDRP
ncbi:MAG: RluA family pseudouridine synthase [Verrucomicrobia bacterium]|nr:RluA family pseudouridine synthase [Verrucomicrobiota bacterium]MDE3098633.1 RluA family pseudouridine synthase [Verrucomicrobiota bacterium]